MCFLQDLESGRTGPACVRPQRQNRQLAASKRLQMKRRRDGTMLCWHADVVSGLLVPVDCLQLSASLRYPTQHFVDVLSLPWICHSQEASGDVHPMLNCEVSGY